MSDQTVAQSRTRVSGSYCLHLCCVLLILLASASTAERDLCRMSGCYCTKHSEDDSISTLSCPDLSNREKFTKIPSLERYPNLTQINLEGNNISIIRAADFDPVRSRLRLIDLDRNKIDTIEEGALRDMPELENIMLAKNSLGSIPRNVFLNRYHISTLDLSHNLFSEFPLGFTMVETYDMLLMNNNPIGNLRSGLISGNLTRIGTLDISNISMTEFDPGDAGFNLLTGLSKLYMNDNHFPTVSKEMMENLPTTVNTLSMRFCGIELIKTKAFERMASLKHLLLDGNNLDILRREPFNGLQLERLDLANCSINKIRRDAFTNLFVLNLYLEDNNLTEINDKEFNERGTSLYTGQKFDIGIRNLTYLNLANCSIRNISGTPFDQLTELTHLVLSNNFLDNESIGRSLRRHQSLSTINLSGNNFTSFPNMPVSKFPHLRNVYITHNVISSISREDLANMSMLYKLKLSNNPLQGFPEDDDTFADTPKLHTLEIKNTTLMRLPNMAHLPNLVYIYADHSKLSFIPKDLCSNSSNLGVLEVQDNHLTDLPTLSCKFLVDLDVSHNKLKTLHKDFLKDMPRLRALNLGDNEIDELDKLFFENSIDMEDLQLGNNGLTTIPTLHFMPHLVRLNLSYNHLTNIPEGTFVDQVKMDWLLLNDNDIDYIHPLSFPVHSDLKILNLSRNSRLKEWVLPRGGFPQLADLYLEEMYELHQIPHTFQIPTVRRLHLTYSYHCCIWDNYVGVFVPNITEEEGSGSLIVTQPTVPDFIPPNFVGAVCKLTDEQLKPILDFYYWQLNVTITVTRFRDGACYVNIINRNTGTVSDGDEILEQFSRMITSRTGINVEFVVRPQNVICTPHQNALTPCESLLDPWILRVAIWFVWCLALVGNGMVMFIIIAPREKLEASEWLILNLAIADFCMGVYLAFIAVVDIRTFGENSFFQSALDWQLGSGCKAAGFIAIFSSTLGMYILVVLTLERVYTISHAFTQKESSKKRTVIVFIMIGWLFASVIALLPILGVNSYNHVAVCLPYLTERLTDRFYIGLVLTQNVVGFLIILGSYIYIFWIACKNAPASNMAQRRKDMLFAVSKIAIVIITTFLCWAPIAVIGYTALLDVKLVDVTKAKYFIVFVYPLNACVNPFIYAFFTKRFRSKCGAIFRKSKDRMTSFPQNHHMRLQPAHSAFTSEYPLTRVSSPSTSARHEELMKLRQSRRSSSLVVQMVDHGFSTPSPSFNPPSGCNLGRRASLPPGFGSTLNIAGCGEQSTPNFPHYPFRLSSLYSSNNSSLPNLQEESDVDLEQDAIFSTAAAGACAIAGGGDRSNPLTSSQESNLRRLSVVEEEEVEVDLAVDACVDPESSSRYECFSSVSSSDEEYSDASDIMEYGGVEQGTDLDFAIQKRNSDAAATEVANQVEVEADGESEFLSDSLRHESDREDSEVELDATEEVLMATRGTGSDSPSPESRRRSSSCEDIHVMCRKESPVTQSCISSHTNLMPILKHWSPEQFPSKRSRSPEMNMDSLSNLYVSEVSCQGPSVEGSQSCVSGISSPLSKLSQTDILSELSQEPHLYGTPSSHKESASQPHHTTVTSSSPPPPPPHPVTRSNSNSPTHRGYSNPLCTAATTHCTSNTSRGTSQGSSTTPSQSNFLSTPRETDV